MRIEREFIKGSLIDLAKRVEAEFIVIDSNAYYVDRYHRSIIDCSGNIAIRNSAEAVSKLVGFSVYKVDNIDGIDIYINRDLVTEKLSDVSRYIGTGGGLQAAAWAKNKKILIQTANKYLPEADRIAETTVWSGGDFDDYVKIKIPRE